MIKYGTIFYPRFLLDEVQHIPYIGMWLFNIEHSYWFMGGFSYEENSEEVLSESLSNFGVERNATVTYVLGLDEDFHVLVELHYILQRIDELERALVVITNTFNLEGAHAIAKRGLNID